MECQCQALLCERRRFYLQLSAIVVPDADCFVLRAGRNQLLTDADVKSGYLALVERAHHIRELWFDGCVIDAFDFKVEAGFD